MTSVFELPGEANPLSRQNVFNALVSAAGTTQQQVQIGGQQLQNWEKEQNYYSFLQVCLCFLNIYIFPYYFYVLCGFRKQ